MGKWFYKFLSIFKEQQQLGEERQIAKHLAKVALYDLSETKALYKDMEDKAIKLQIVMSDMEMDIWFVETFRTATVQDEYYSRGRTKSGNVITAAKGLESYHQYGLAFDVAFIKHNWNPPSIEWWSILGREGKKLGLDWGGDWGDMGHFEFHPGFTWHELRDYFL